MKVSNKVNFLLKHPLAASVCLLSGDKDQITAARIIDAAKQMQKAHPGVRTALEDVEEYLGLPREVAALNMSRGVSLVLRRWERENPYTPEEVREFYQHCSEYLYDLAYWNMMNRSYQQLLTLISSERCGKCLSFGGGIGTEALTLAAQGNEVWYCDIPDAPVWKFAQWRARRANTQVHFTPEIPDNVSFDCIVAFDVFEHLVDAEVESVLRRMARVLKPGGRLYCHNPFGPTDAHPMHYDHTELWNSLLTQLPLKPMEEHIYRKAAIPEIP